MGSPGLVFVCSDVIMLTFSEHQNGISALFSYVLVLDLENFSPNDG